MKCETCEFFRLKNTKDRPLICCTCGLKMAVVALRESFDESYVGKFIGKVRDILDFRRW